MCQLCYLLHMCYLLRFSETLDGISTAVMLISQRRGQSSELGCNSFQVTKLVSEGAALRLLCPQSLKPPLLVAASPTPTQCTPRTQLPRPSAPHPPAAVLTLGNATEELELHGQAEQVVEERDPDTLHALFVPLVKPAAAAEYGSVHYVCGQGQGLSEVPAP